jgi:acyl carrier protein
LDDRVRHIIAVALELPEQEVDEHLGAEHTANWDSIRHLNLVMALEDAFAVSFSTDELTALTSYRAIMEALAQRGVA